MTGQSSNFWGTPVMGVSRWIAFDPISRERRLLCLNLSLSQKAFCGMFSSE